MNIIVNPIFAKDFDTTICENDFPCTWRGLTFDTIGTKEILYQTVHGCDSMITMQLKTSKPEACIMLSPDIDTYMTGSTILFADCSASAVGWHWNLGNNYMSNAQSFHYAYDMSGTYTVTLIVNDQYGCMDTASREITIEDDMHFYIPCSITPNGDGINDVFLPVGINIPNEGYVLSIFNRWGEMIFTTHDLNQGWDGKVNGRYVKSGTVFNYMIRYQNNSGRQFMKRGTVTVL